MIKVVFDIETDGLDPTVIWCIAAEVVDKPWIKKTWTPDTIHQFPQWLGKIKADVLIGHNIIGYDLPVLKKLLDFFWWGDVEDTLVISRLHNPSRDKGHSLKAWGIKMGFPKGDYDEWDKYTPEMLEYCIRDVEVTSRIYDLLSNENIPKEALDMEYKVARIINTQSKNGWKFNSGKAISLLADMKQEMFIVEDEVRKVFVPLPVWNKLNHPLDKAFKGNFSKLEYSKRFQSQLDKGAYFNEEGEWGHTTYPPFNLGSRPQIIRQLQHFGWKPKKFTEKDTAIVSDEILQGLKFPEGKLIAKYIMIQKKVAMVSSWLEAVNNSKDDRIRGTVNSNGAVTGRMTHSKPNLAQVPASKKNKQGELVWGLESEYGTDCRSLFEVEKGYKLVGCDASGLELRMLAHYMNDESYTKEVIEGDIHTANMKAAGLNNRDQAKTFIYGFLYGAGPTKVGQIVGGGYEEGLNLTENFLNSIPKLGKLREEVLKKAESGVINGLDGRKVHIRSSHSALNTLLQGAGALVMKQALILLDKYAKIYKLKYRFVGNIHDEIQTEVREDQAERFGRLAVDCIKLAGEHFKLNCPLDAEYKIGNSWEKTH